MKRLLLVIFMVSALLSCSRSVDVLIVGGGTGGVAAGIQAARSGAKTLIVEEGPWLGGMLTSAGVSAIDGNYNLRGGIFAEFTDSLASHYGGYDSLRTGWVSNIMFEPHVGEEILKKMVAKERLLDVEYGVSFVRAVKTADGWNVILADGGSDGGMSKTKSKITTKTNSKSMSKSNPMSISKIMTKLKSKITTKTIKAKVLIDATELGDVAAACGVRYSVGMDSKYDTGEAIAPEEANDIVQDMTYTVILKDYGPGADKTIARPESYDADMFANCCKSRLNKAARRPGQVFWSPQEMLDYGKLPGGKYMINWPIEGNDWYANVIEMSPEERLAEYEKAKDFTRCFVYYMQTELGFKNLGIADDEFPTEDGFPLIPYHREARRIDGEAFFTVDHAAKPFSQKEHLYRTGIAVGDYAVDHHHYRHPNWESLPKLHFYPIPSFNVPLGCLIPKDVDNLIMAEKSISVSNIMNGATRLQPVVMQIGQAAGALAALAVANDINVREVPVRDVQDALLGAGAYIMPYRDLKPSDEDFAVMQRIGATGLVKGDGRNEGWSNQTWFNTGDCPEAREAGLSNLEYARIIDRECDPFHSREVDLQGNFKTL